MALQSFCWTLAAFSVSSSYTQSVRLLVQRIIPSQGRYLHTEFLQEIIICKTRATKILALWNTKIIQIHMQNI
jgi:hypothetical protein